MRYAAVLPFASNPKLRLTAPVRVSTTQPRIPRQRIRTYARDNEGPQGDEVIPPEEMKRLAVPRRQPQADFLKDANVVEGALEEAQLITWPSRQKALLDTVLVLFIVAGSGAMIFGMNVLLAELSEWWYHLA